MVYQLLSSTRFDDFLLSLGWNKDLYDQSTASSFLLLPFNYDRLMKAAERHGWKVSLSYTELKEKCLQAVVEARSSGTEGPLKIRITLSTESELAVTTSPVRHIYIDPAHESFFLPPGVREPKIEFALSVDTEATPSSLFTSTKTTRRPHYDAARARVNLVSYADPKDVVLYNEEGDITETSIANLAFYRGGRWVTPATSTGCLEGVMRRCLLQDGKMQEGIIKKGDLRDGEQVLVFNGVAGCTRAKIVL